MAEGFSLSGWLASFQIGWLTLWRGEKVGVDAYGNRYYRDRKHLLHGKERRWVLYAGQAEASKVPPEWHGWLHHTFDSPLPDNSAQQKPWIKPHQPNRTGEQGLTPYPPVLATSQPPSDRRYTPWSPEPNA